jgi:DNA-binding Lrp family transcriptional regulator
VPVDFKDAVNARILAVSEDRLQGFQRDPLGEIARQSGVDLSLVIERIQAMLRAGTIRRVRQTLLATNLAQGALVAWQAPQEKLEPAFDFMFQRDPFSGHVVIRSTDAATPGSNYKLWTTVKVPQGFSLQKHCEFLARQTGAEKFRLLPAKRLFALGVGHTRRRGMEPGSKADVPAEATEVKVVELSDLEWRILTALKREFAAEELIVNLWQPRADEAGVPLEKFLEIAEDFNRRGIIGRFSTFLEHVKPLKGGDHGTDKAMVLAHKAAIDAHLATVGIPILYTNVFWGGRSEIKPSEISPFAYRDWCRAMGLDPEQMREQPAAAT